MTDEQDAAVYGCCQHCTDYDSGEDMCPNAPHDDQCVQPYCSGGRAVECPTPESDALAECVYEFHIRGETNNLWCVTHEMWRDKSEASSDPNLEHLHGTGCMCGWCTSERLTYCILTRGVSNHPDHQVLGCPATTVIPPGSSGS